MDSIPVYGSYGYFPPDVWRLIFTHLDRRHIDLMIQVHPILFTPLLFECVRKKIPVISECGTSKLKFVFLPSKGKYDNERNYCTNFPFFSLVFLSTHELVSVDDFLGSKWNEDPVKRKQLSPRRVDFFQTPVDSNSFPTNSVAPFAKVRNLKGFLLLFSFAMLFSSDCTRLCSLPSCVYISASRAFLLFLSLLISFSSLPLYLLLLWVYFFCFSPSLSPSPSFLLT